MVSSRTERNLPLDELRRLRAGLVEEEVGLSFLRRLVQARLDIVRASGGGRDVADLVDSLPAILADRTHAPGPGRLPRVMAPSPAEEARLEAELDAVVPAATFTDLDALDDDGRAEIVRRLSDFERDVSARRREMHDRIDALQAELTRRYKTGEADVEALLR